MGEAKRRGTYQQRAAFAHERDKSAALSKLGHDPTSPNMAALRAAIDLFTGVLGDGVWSKRRAAIVEQLKTLPGAEALQHTDAIRVRADEICWYLFLAEQALNDPLCIDTGQSQRCLPFLAAIGKRIQFASRVTGLRDKLIECLGTYKADPDGTLFEINVALAYAEAGWAVTFIPSTRGAKSPDFLAERNGQQLYVECKRQSRRADYAERERDEFLRVWHPVPDILRTNRQWLWIKAAFSVEASAIPTNFLVDTLRPHLPFQGGPRTVYSGDLGQIDVRYIDRERVLDHLRNFQVKLNSPALTQLLAADWAPMNSAVTAAFVAKLTHVTDCEAPVLGAFINELNWASGITRSFSGDVSIDKKARDVRNKIRDAEKQLPADSQSVVHIAVETLEGDDVEQIRQDRIRNSIREFGTEKPLVAIRVHFFQSNAAPDEIFLFDETVMRFDRQDGLCIPMQVIVDAEADMRHGAHWDRA